MKFEWGTSISMCWAAIGLRREKFVRRVGIKEVAETLNISYGSTQQIVVHSLGMKRVAARLLPKNRHIPAWLWLNFWLNTKQEMVNHHICQIWLPVTFYCFQNSNIRSGERAMSRLRP